MSACLRDCLAGSREATDFSRAARYADAPARRHGLVAQGMHGGALMARFMLSGCKLARGRRPHPAKIGRLRMAVGPFARSNLSYLVLNDVS